jgi:hypothetical protein
MRRGVFSVLSGVSLLMACVMVALWVRNYWSSDFLWYGHIGAHIERVGVITAPGRIRLFIDREKGAPAMGNEWSYSSWPASRAEAEVGPGYASFYLQALGFSFSIDRFAGFVRGVQFAVPHWFAVAVFLIAPIWWVRREVRRRSMLRRREHAYSRCGYDLRAHVAGENCPECGGLIERKTGVAKKTGRECGEAR